MRGSRVVFVAALFLGAALLWQGLQWYSAYLDRISRGPAVPAVPTVASAPSSPAPVAAPTPLPDPTPAELEALLSADADVQVKACSTLRERRATPEYLKTVEQALARGPTKDNAYRLECLKARFPGTEALEFALSRAAAPEMMREDRTEPGVECLLSVLAERAAEDPERVRDALLPAAFSRNAVLRQIAEDGLRRVHLPTLPKPLLERTRAASNHERLFAFEAAIALGALGIDPSLIDRALEDDYQGVRNAARWELLTSPLPAAPRVIARAIAREPRSRKRTELFRERDRKHRDASSALVEVALDESVALGQRQAALEVLGTVGSPGAADRLRPLEESLNEPVRAYAAAAVAELRRRTVPGTQYEMKSLPK